MSAGTFLAHILEVHRILRLLGRPRRSVPVPSAASTSTSPSSTLALAAAVGDGAKLIVNLFCLVPRQQIIQCSLLFRYTDGYLATDLARSDQSVPDGVAVACSLMPRSWCRKI
jgi:hypothetical protein